MAAYKVLFLNPELCTGCRTCEMVCSLDKEGECNPAKSRIKVLTLLKDGIDIPAFCQHCEYAPCLDVCPINAVKRNRETGAVEINSEVCIGCRACMLVCPYGALRLDLNRRVMVKCDLCGGDPKCARFCITKALTYERQDVLETKKQYNSYSRFIDPLVKARKAREEVKYVD